MSEYESVYERAELETRLDKVAVWNKKTDMLHLRHPLELDRSLSDKAFRALCSTRGLTLDKLIRTKSEARVLAVDFKSRMEKFCRFDEENKIYHLHNQDYSIVREIRKEEAAVDSGVEELEDTEAQSKINAARTVELSEATRLRRDQDKAKKNKYKVRARSSPFHICNSS